MADLTGLLSSVAYGSATGWDKGREQKYAAEKEQAKRLQELSLKQIAHENRMTEVDHAADRDMENRIYSADRTQDLTDEAVDRNKTNVKSWGAAEKGEDNKYYQQGYDANGLLLEGARRIADNPNKTLEAQTAKDLKIAKDKLDADRFKLFTEENTVLRKLEEKRAELFTVKSLKGSEGNGLLDENVKAPNNDAAVAQYDQLIENQHNRMEQMFPELSGANKRSSAKRKKAILGEVKHSKSDYNKMKPTDIAELFKSSTAEQKQDMMATLTPELKQEVRTVIENAVKKEQPVVQNKQTMSAGLVIPETLNNDTNQQGLLVRLATDKKKNIANLKKRIKKATGAKKRTLQKALAKLESQQ